MLKFKRIELTGVGHTKFQNQLPYANAGWLFAQHRSGGMVDLVQALAGKTGKPPGRFLNMQINLHRRFACKFLLLLAANRWSTGLALWAWQCGPVAARAGFANREAPDLQHA